MNTNPKFSPTVIVGLGESGFSCVEYFVERDLPVQVIDTRAMPPKLAEFKARYPDIQVYTGGFVKEVLQQAKTIVLSPSISKYHPEIVNACTPHTDIVGDIELFARNAMSSAPIIAITGSNGKSTVTTLVGEMAKAARKKVGVGGNLGIPALSLLSDKTELYVLELSSFQLETTYSLKPKVATILNISPDHLDRYPTLESYLDAKCRIYHNCEKVVVNREEMAILQYVAQHVPAKVPCISFGLDVPPENHFGLIPEANTGVVWIAKGFKRLLPTSKLKLFGRHNIQNALAALALADSIEIPMDAMLTTLETFSGLPHRCEWIREFNGVQWINDSKGTNVGATVSALQGLSAEIKGKWVLIAGGLGKNADFAPLKSVVAENCSAVVLMGEAASELEALFSAEVPCVRVNSLQEAVLASARLSKPGDGVLLSPACASYDMFKNFEERGQAFKTAVMALA